MSGPHDTFLHIENLKGLRLKLAAESDPVKRAVLAGLLAQEAAGMLSPPQPNWPAKPR